METGMNLKLLRTGIAAAAFIVALQPAVTRAQDGDEPELAQGENVLAGLASELIEGKCACPNEETAATVKKLDRCLNNNAKKAREKFAPTVKYLGLSNRLFKSALDESLSAYKEGCFAPEEEEEPPLEELPGEDEF
jgi:hypothetical protein